MPNRQRGECMVRYAVGIDLGTSHTVVAYADLAATAPSVQLFHIPQWVAAGQVAALPCLPSVRYHPAVGELPTAQATAFAAAISHLNDTASPAPVLGTWARDLGAQVPGRLVSSAKSWLSHTGVDRTAAILPWGAAEDVARVSPVQASASYLAHVRGAWNAEFPHAPLEAQDLTLTVPASFDEGARALTLEAAALAGLPRLRLLEEPQAVCYDWLLQHRQTLQTELADCRLLLVVDVGGGTTDLTLIQIAHAEHDPLPQLTRIGVGDHLMLGGDNMDLALAHHVECQWGSNQALSAARLSQLVQRCRLAKEALLSAEAPDEVSVTLLGGGSRLIGSSRSVSLPREQVQPWLLDGFLPLAPATERPRKRRSAIVEFGLPYPADPAITHHLAEFLQQHAQVARTALGAEEGDCVGGFPVPDVVLLNGGVFRSRALTERLLAILAHWRGRPLRCLQHDRPDVAVACGAVAHALWRQQRLPALGAGIGGGAARSYFLQLESGKTKQALCLLPRGTPEGVTVHVSAQRFALRLGQAVRFHLWSASDDGAPEAGQLLPLADSWLPLPTLVTVLHTPAGASAERRRTEVVVELEATMTEIGTLDICAVAVDETTARWPLRFDVRQSADVATETDPASVAQPHPQWSAAIALLDRIFGDSAQRLEGREVRQLRAGLERCFGVRETWELPLLRALFDALLQRSKRRRRSADHERVWLNLAGYCLRPGTGAALDEWRIAQLWPVYEQGVQFAAVSNNWSEWWTLWRRAAGGLTDVQQQELLQTVGAHLEQIVTSRHTGQPLKGSYDDMLRLVAALERVPAPYRAELGHWLVGRLQKLAQQHKTHAGTAAKGLESSSAWWVVGRLGARVSLYGQAQNVVAPEVAEAWLQAVLALDWRKVETAAFAAVQIARLSGDRARDLPADTRALVLQRLADIKAPSVWSQMLSEVLPLAVAEQRLSYGEALPVGLRLLPN